MLDHELPAGFISRINALGSLQTSDGTVPIEARAEAGDLAGEIAAEATHLARRFGQAGYADAIAADFKAWIATGFSESPDFSFSRDALLPPADGMPFFFAGPLRLANGGRTGWRMECFLALREEPRSEAYRALYEMFPHPKNICQSSHLLAGSQGLTSGNNIVFFPENIQACSPISVQAYAVFFFNKFHEIYNNITLRKVREATSDMKVVNPTGDNIRGTYLARCVWGYLHDYFHHQGARPFDQHVSIKTRWYTGLLEETKVDLETWLACRENEFVDADAVAEFILFDRAFRYPCEPDWHRNFDSGTGLLLLSLLEANGGLSIFDDGSITIDIAAVPAIARGFISDVRRIEALPDEGYLAAAKEMVRRYLPEGTRGERIGFPAALSCSRMRNLVGSAADPIAFTPEQLSRSLESLHA
jgi:hypothetical protein